MRFLRRQRKSAISNIGFRRSCCLLLMVCTLLTVIAPVEAKAAQVGSEIQEAADGGQELQAATLRGEAQQFSVKESTEERMAQINGKQSMGRARGLRQTKLLILPVGTLFSEKPQLFKCFFSVGNAKQKELVLRSQRIVEFICKADGKKNGLFSFIG